MFECHASLRKRLRSVENALNEAQLSRTARKFVLVRARQKLRSRWKRRDAAPVGPAPAPSGAKEFTRLHPFKRSERR